MKPITGDTAHHMSEINEVLRTGDERTVAVIASLLQQITDRDAALAAVIMTHGEGGKIDITAQKFNECFALRVRPCLDDETGVVQLQLSSIQANKDGALN